jgi:hypothetical protein
MDISIRHLRKIICVREPGLSLSIIIHSRVKIIDNERPGASPCDPRRRLHVHILRFHFLFHAEAANRKQIENIAARGTTQVK